MKTRKYLAILLVVMMLVTTALTACSNKETAPSSSSDTGASSVSASAVEKDALGEAPMLQTMVSEGKLAPVKDRLPEKTFTLAPKAEIGVYGGTFYGAFPAGYQYQGYETLGFYEPIITWNSDRTELIPNFAESFEQSADGTSFTFVLRKGLKWSNGDPVTTEDVRYYIEDVAGNTDMSPSFPSHLTTKGEKVQLTIKDDYTFTLKFTTPNPTFPYTICRDGYNFVVPSNYLKKFNNKYIEVAKLNEQAKAKGFDDWGKYYNNISNFRQNPELPVLYAWKLESLSSDALTRTFVRNPYYHKVDTKGNQLPYMDKVQVEYVDNLETLKLKVISGEVDYIYAPTGEDFSQYPMMAENAKSGNYKLILAGGDYGHVFMVMPNMASQDPQKGQLFANKDFRVALSYAINREEFISLLVSVADYKGVSAQQSPVESSPFYNEELTKQYTEYSPDKANKLLDDIGITARDSKGYRLGPDGKEMLIQLTIPTYSELWVDGGMRIAEYWKAVGLNVEVKPVAPDIWYEMDTANKIDIQILSSGSGGLMVVNSDGIDAYSVPYAGWTQKWGSAFGQYVASNGKKGIKPPEFVNKLNQLREEILFGNNADGGKAKVAELLKVWGEAFPLIGISRPLPMFLVCSNNLYNTPEDGEAWVTFTYGVGGNVNPCQFYKK